MIADDILQALNPRDGLTDNFRGMFERAVKVNINNVSDYYFSNPKDKWRPDDFPSVAPPWELFWMEWTMPAVFYSDNPSRNMLEAAEAGIVRCEKLPDGVYRFWGTKERRAVIAHASEPEWAKEFNARWILLLRAFNLEVPGAYIMEQTFFIGAQGELLFVPSTHESHRLLAQRIPEFATATIGPTSPTPGMHLAPRRLSLFMTAAYNSVGVTIDESFFDPVFLALSFCNCKNVTVSRAPLSLKLQKKRARHDRVKVDAYHTIMIAPMRKILDDSAPRGTSLQHRLRIRRGHFKTFTAERPLFGKHIGSWWWPQWMRDGDQEAVNYKVEGGDAK